MKYLFSPNYSFMHLEQHVPSPTPEQYVPTKENLPKLYDEFAQYEDLGRFGRILHAVAKVACHPTVTFGGDDQEQLRQGEKEIPEQRQDVEARVQAWLDAGNPILLLEPHQHYLDQFADLAATLKSRTLNRIGKLGSVAAKAEYFDIDPSEPMHKRVYKRIQSYAFRSLRAFPTYRNPDIETINAKHPEAEITRENIIEATEHWNNFIIEKRFKKGRSVLIYPEGTRKRALWTEVGKIMAGVPNLVIEVERRNAEISDQDEKIDLGVLIAGRSFGLDHEPRDRLEALVKMRWRKPHLHAGWFQEGGFGTERQNRKSLTRVIQCELQESRDEASRRIAMKPRFSPKILNRLSAKVKTSS